MRSEPMMRKHRDPVESGRDELGAALHRVGIGAMQLGTLARQEVLVDRGPRQCVTEAVATARGVDDEQLALDRLAQRCIQLGVGKYGHQTQQSVGHPATSARGDPQHMLGGVGQALGPGQQYVTQRRRKVIGTEAPSRTAPSSSSTNSGIPSERSNTRSIRSPSGRSAMIRSRRAAGAATSSAMKSSVARSAD